MREVDTANISKHVGTSSSSNNTKECSRHKRWGSHCGSEVHTSGTWGPRGWTDLVGVGTAWQGEKQFGFSINIWWTLCLVCLSTPSNPPQFIAKVPVKSQHSAEGRGALLFSFFLAPLHSLWDLSSLTREWTWAPAMRTSSPNHWIAREFPSHGFF